MLVIVGAILVAVSVFGGFLMEGGHMEVLIQPIELLIIGGAAAGSLLIGSSGDLLKDIGHQLGGTLKGSGPSKSNYVEVVTLIFELCKTAKANPLSIEAHVENPASSEIFKKYPFVLSNHHALEFLCDSLKVQISAPMSPFDFDDLMDKDIQTVHQQEHKAPAMVNKVGDAMPGLGIVAAVLGVVITMGKLTQGKDVIGHSVAAALVGTFIGILLSYGFVGPLASKMEGNLAEQGKVLEVIKAGLLAYSKNCSPKVCAEFARRSIPPTVRPTFEEIDKATSGKAA